MLKEKLLNTTLFLDNEALQSYITIIIENKYSQLQKGKTQKHHIFPKCLAKRLNCPVDDTTNNLVNLSYKDHILAHYYLIYATNDDYLKAANIHAFNHLLKKQGHWLDEVSLQALLAKQQLVYEQTSYLRSAHSRRINSGGCYVNNGIKAKHIRLEELQSYLAQGWVRGQIQNHSSAKGLIVITNGVKERRITKEELPTFLATGWQVGRITKGRTQPKASYIVVCSPELGIERHISAEEKEVFLAKGYKLGGLKHKKPYKKCPTSQAGKATKNKIWIHLENQTKMVLPENAQQYLDNGWLLGRGKRNK